MTKRKTNIVMCNGRVLAGRDMRIHDNIKKEIAIFIQNKRNINHGNTKEALNDNTRD